jgi:hypothetical protein
MVPHTTLRSLRLVPPQFMAKVDEALRLHLHL